MNNNMNYINNLPNINETFIIEPAAESGGTGTVSACTGFFTNLIISCDAPDTQIGLDVSEITVSKPLVPVVDGITDLGLPLKRFRQLNTVSGTSTYWTSTNARINSLTVDTVDLGFDSNGDHRILTANSSVLNFDILKAGNY